MSVQVEDSNKSQEFKLPTGWRRTEMINGSPGLSIPRICYVGPNGQIAKNKQELQQFLGDKIEIGNFNWKSGILSPPMNLKKGASMNGHTNRFAPYGKRSTRPPTRYNPNLGKLSITVIRSHPESSTYENPPFRTDINYSNAFIRNRQPPRPLFWEKRLERFMDSRTSCALALPPSLSFLFSPLHSSSLEEGSLSFDGLLTSRSAPSTPLLKSEATSSTSSSLPTSSSNQIGPVASGSGMPNSKPIATVMPLGSPTHSVSYTSASGSATPRSPLHVPSTQSVTSTITSAAQTLAQNLNAAAVFEPLHIDRATTVRSVLSLLEEAEKSARDRKRHPELQGVWNVIERDESGCPIVGQRGMLEAAKASMIPSSTGSGSPSASKSPGLNAPLLSDQPASYLFCYALTKHTRLTLPVRTRDTRQPLCAPFKVNTKGLLEIAREERLHSERISALRRQLAEARTAFDPFSNYVESARALTPTLPSSNDAQEPAQAQTIPEMK